jgi:hypothetical protein
MGEPRLRCSSVRSPNRSKLIEPNWNRGVSGVERVSNRVFQPLITLKHGGKVWIPKRAAPWWRLT